MARLPLIGVTLNGDLPFAGVSCREAYYQKIEAAGGLPLLLPPLAQLSPAYLERLDGLLLTGGGDMAAELFGQQPYAKAQPADTTRDQFELALLQQAWQKRLPILGICRGMQVLNIALGGDLWQDLSLRGQPSLNHDQSLPREQTSHTVTICHPPLAAALGGAQLPTNSHHHQAVNRIAPELQSVGHTADGVTELLCARDESRFALGLQWHPETLSNGLPPFRLLLQAITG